MSTRTEHHPKPPLYFRYKNHRGIIENREVTGAYLWFGATDFHPEPQWMIRAFCTVRQEYRDFAVRGILHFNPSPNTGRIVPPHGSGP